MAMMENPYHFVGGVERTGDGAHAKSQIKGQRESTQRAKPTHGRALLLHLGKYVKINISQYRHQHGIWEWPNGVLWTTINCKLSSLILFNYAAI